MKTNCSIISIIAAIVWTVGLSNGLSKDCFELESHYNGDGWFTYTLRTLDDPLISEIRLYQLDPLFTNFVASVPPAHWTNFVYQGSWEGIMYDQSSPQPRLNEITFSARSSFTTFKRQPLGLTAVVFIQLAPLMGGEGYGGYVKLDCLVPCPPEEADGSPPDLVSRLELIPDVQVAGLIVTNSAVYGLTFSWNEPSTVELQGSHDMTHWTPVTRLFGDPPQTTWTTNVPLNSFGEFFRLMLVANRHVTNNLASVKLGSQYSSETPIVREEMIRGQIRVGFTSVPDALYEVTCCEMSGQPLTAKQIQARNSFTSLLFPISEPRSAARFKARRLSP